MVVNEVKSSCQLVASGVLQGLQGLVLLDVFASDVDEWAECTPSKSANSTLLSSVDLLRVGRLHREIWTGWIYGEVLVEYDEGGSQLNMGWQYAHRWPRRPTPSWLMLETMWPAGIEKLLSHHTWNWWGCILCNVFDFGPQTTRRILKCIQGRTMKLMRSLGYMSYEELHQWLLGKIPSVERLSNIGTNITGK